MAGPGCSVFSPIPFSANDIIQELVRLECLTVSASDRNWLSVTNTHPIGGTYKGDGRPIIWDYLSRDAEHLAKIAEVLGVVPKGEILLAAMRSGDIDHRVLGEMALWIAEKTCGFVDLDGNPGIEGTWAGLPGQLARIPYETDSGWDGESLVMDRAAIRYWLKCPSFRMVK